MKENAKPPFATTGFHVTTDKACGVRLPDLSVCFDVVVFFSRCCIISTYWHLIHIARYTEPPHFVNIEAAFTACLR